MYRSTITSVSPVSHAFTQFYRLYQKISNTNKTAQRKGRGRVQEGREKLPIFESMRNFHLPSLPHVMSTLFFLFMTSVSIAQIASDRWSQHEIERANLAENTPNWTDEEKDVLLHLNLVRLFPRKYWEFEVQSQEGGSYYPKELASLKSTLLVMNPVNALVPDVQLTSEAACLAQLQSKSGHTGHDRGMSCPTSSTFSYWAENCDYGNLDGADVIVHLLIDGGVKSLGHRKNCLNPNYQFVGVAQDTHTKYRFVTVMDFKGG